MRIPYKTVICKGLIPAEGLAEWLAYDDAVAELVALNRIRTRGGVLTKLQQAELRGAEARKARHAQNIVTNKWSMTEVEPTL